jgi:hypothetical protein
MCDVDENEKRTFIFSLPSVWVEDLASAVVAFTLAAGGTLSVFAITTLWVLPLVAAFAAGADILGGVVSFDNVIGASGALPPVASELSVSSLSGCAPASHVRQD